VPKASVFEVELASEEPKIHKSPAIDKIPAKLIKVAGGVEHFAMRSTNLLLLIGIRRNYLRSGRSR
jgi:hypothetical protein